MTRTSRRLAATRFSRTRAKRGPTDDGRVVCAKTKRRGQKKARVPTAVHATAVSGAPQLRAVVKRNVFF